MNKEQLFGVAYARVSTEDQAKKELSVPAQFRRIDDFANNNNITIVYRDADEGVTAFKDTENRDAFERTVKYACEDPRVSLFLIDDQERFYRDKYLSGETKARLRRHGVYVLITSDPYDPRTIEGVWRESIGEALGQTSSMKTAFYTFRGMEENIQKRDLVTGWCFKNGGIAPFGYRAYHVVRGQDSRGRDIVKTLWEINEDAAEVKRFMYEKRSEGLSYKAIWKLLNQNNMIGPTPGKPWTISSIIEMMREDRVLQDAGWAIWNKEDHETCGRRFKDKSKWVWVEKAHPAIISLELANAVLEVNKQKSQDMSFRRGEASPYLLTGKNISNEDLFVCLACGARMTGYKPSKRHRPGYICGSVQYRGATTCISKPLDQKFIESYILNKIREIYGTEAAANAIAKKINDSLKTNDGKGREKNKIIRQLESIEVKIKNLVKAVADGIDISIIKPEIDALRMEKSKLEESLKVLEKAAFIRPKFVTAEEILEVYQKLEEAFDLQEPAKKRKLLRNFVRRLEYEPKSDSLTIYMFAEPTTVVWYSSGAQDRAQYEYHIEKVSKQR